MMLIGQQLGHYRLVRLIGQGGMGEIYLAEDTRMPRQVAVKIVRNERQSSPDAKASQQAERLFQREMQAIAQLDHPHILSLHDFGEQQLADGSVIYMVMPYRPEGSLANWLLQRGSELLAAPQNVGQMIMQAASALQHAHDRNIIHQDVKPSNFLVCANVDSPMRPDLLLVDFGIARVMSATATASNSVRGTHAYMAPEQWNGEAVAATDQYALAIMAYQLLTGQLPFLQGQPDQMMFQHFTVPPKPPSQINACLSPAVDAVILRALAKQASERFPSIKTFALALQQAIAYEDLRATMVITAEEALQGGRRTITLPSQQQVMVTIPLSAQDGQVLQLPGQGTPYYDGGPRGRLQIALSVANVGKQDVSTAPVSSKLNQLTTDVGAYQLRIKGLMGSLANTGNKLLKRRASLVVTIVLLLIVGSTLTTRFVDNQIENTNVQATAIARAQATVQAQVIPTAIAQAQATATIMVANPDPYPPAGTLAFVDPLSQPNLWFDSSNTCQFVNGVYQISQPLTGGGNGNVMGSGCYEDNLYSNFTFEVKMTINHGDCGGLEMRVNRGVTPYNFLVCQDGSYEFLKYTTPGTVTYLTNHDSSAIERGTGKANIIAVVANGSNFDLYVNGQKIDSVSDSAYSHGYVGLMTYAWNNATTVTYQDARLWKI